MAVEHDRWATELRAALQARVDRGELPGAVAGVWRGGERVVAAVGTPAFDDPTPLREDARFRIASISKPITAAAAMTYVDDGTLRLDEVVSRWLPELSTPRVLPRLDAALDEAMPAVRPIRVVDLLTYRLGFGKIFAPPAGLPIQRAEAALDLGTLGAPWPLPPFGADEWLRRFATLPLLDEPGTAWRYHTSGQVLGILLERVAGRPLEAVLRERIFAPLGMTATAFSFPVDPTAQRTTAYAPHPTSGEPRFFDGPTGEWARPPRFADAAAGLVSTLADLSAFAAMLAEDGTFRGRRVLSEAAVRAMTTNHLSPEERSANTLFLGLHGGWGYGMAAPVAGEAPAGWPRGYGWDGGLGCTWRTDPISGTTGILLTQRALLSPRPPDVFREFWRFVARMPQAR